jgi:hypothetical protein
LIAIKREHLKPNRIRESSRSAPGSQDEDDCLWWLLRIRQIDARHGRRVAALLIDIRGDADDLKRLFTRANKQPLSQRILAARIERPEAACQAFIDDDDAGRAGIVTSGETAPTHQRDLKGAEVVR